VSRALRAAAYVRSFPGDEEGPGAAEQRRRLEQQIEERGWELTRVFEDKARQAVPRDTPALGAALDQAAELDRLVAVSVDRVAFSVQRLRFVLDRLREAGCELVSLDEAFDTGEASGESLPAVMAALAKRRPAARPMTGWTAERLRRHGFAPATLIDVGVAHGTPVLYEAFPDAEPVLIEPLAEYEPNLEAIVDEHGGEYLLVAVGAAPGSLTMNVSPNPLMTSALATVDPLLYSDQREVPLTTLDILFEERGWATPIGLKLDVEGLEHEVVQGARSLLEETQFVIAEVSVTSRFVGECTSTEFIALMKSHGFGVCDIVDTGSSSLGLHADLLFQRESVTGELNPATG
jgi:FkbM family methyltransferase